MRTPAPEFAGLTSEIVAAYVAHNAVQTHDLPSLIGEVYRALAGLGQPAVPTEPDTKANAAAIRKSITPDGLVSFVDGKSYKTLKRHLGRNGLTPAEYRERYGLPADYPMTATNYSEMRSTLAKSLGLGQARAKARAAAAPVPVPAAAPPKRRGRGGKTS